MARDGTNRGGRRPRSGPGKDALADKLLKGRPAEVMEFHMAALEDCAMPEGADMEGEDIPKPSDFLSAMQTDGKTLGADIIYNETMEWLKKRGCAGLINPRQVESYSEAFARYIQCSKAVSKYGLLGKHPTTKVAIASPMVTMALQYQKQANLMWYEIFSVVKENNLKPYEGMPGGDMMEQILNGDRNGW